MKTLSEIINVIKNILNNPRYWKIIIKNYLINIMYPESMILIFKEAPSERQGLTLTITGLTSQNLFFITRLMVNVAFQSFPTLSKRDQKKILISTINSFAEHEKEYLNEIITELEQKNYDWSVICPMDSVERV